MKRLSRYLSLAGIVLFVGGPALQAQTPAYTAAVLADNPAGFWQFEDGDTSTGMTAADSSPTAGTNDGIYRGTVDSIPGRGAGNGILINPEMADVGGFDSGDLVDYVRIEDTFGGALGSTSATYEAMVRPSYAFHPDGCCGNWMVRGGFFGSDGNIHATFVQQRPASNSNPPGGGINSGPNAGVGSVVANAEPLQKNRWTHVAVVFDGDSIPGDTTTAIYFDGALAAEYVNTVGVSAGNPVNSPGSVMNDSTGDGISIGALPFGDGVAIDIFDNMIQAFKGGLDEVAYYDYALSGGRIAAHAAASPEPASGLMLLMGLMGIFSMARRRK